MTLILEGAVQCKVILSKGPPAHEKKKRREEELENHIRLLWSLSRRLPYGLRCLLLVLMPLFSFRPFVAGLQYEITAELGDKGQKKNQKKRWRFVLDVKRLTILTSDAVCLTHLHLLAILELLRWCFEHYLSLAATWPSCAFDRGFRPLRSYFGFNSNWLHNDDLLLHLRG